jgi:hypothetical protein
MLLLLLLRLPPCLWLQLLFALQNNCRVAQLLPPLCPTMDSCWYSMWPTVCSLLLLLLLQA